MLFAGAREFRIKLFADNWGIEAKNPETGSWEFVRDGFASRIDASVYLFQQVGIVL
jgi:hypothetical protein